MFLFLFFCGIGVGGGGVGGALISPNIGKHVPCYFRRATAERGEGTHSFRGVLGSRVRG